MSKNLIIGDVHAHFVDWTVLEEIRGFARHYKPDLIIQMGDLIDAHNWGKYLRYPDSPSAAEEWDLTEETIHKIHAMFKGFNLVILEGNHCRRPMMRALEVNLPKKLIRPLSDLFPFDNWRWHVEPKPFVQEGVAYVHGDEIPGCNTAWQKAARMGMSVVQGHDHQGEIKFLNTFQHRIFGMSVGTVMNQDSIGARYASKNPLKCFKGFATVTDGAPILYPAG